MRARRPAAALCLLLLAAPGASGHRLAQRPRSARRWGPMLLATLGMGARAHTPAFVAYIEACDEDGDGFLDPVEFRKAFGSMHVGVQDIEALREQLFAYADLDGNGLLSISETAYADFVAATAAHERVVAMVAEFARRSVARTAEETVRTGVEPEVAYNFGQDVAAKIMEDHDMDGDGRLSREEFFDGMRESATAWGWGMYADDPDITMWYNVVFTKGDVDGDGALSPKEAHFAVLMAEVDAAQEGVFADKKIAQLMFAELDHDRDGLIAEAEMARGVAEVRAIIDHSMEPGMLMVELVLANWAQHDVDGDGSLNREEALALGAQLLADLKGFKEPPGE